MSLQRMTFPSALKESDVLSYFSPFFKKDFYPIYDNQMYLQATNFTCGLECFFINSPQVDLVYLLITTTGIG